ncbi:hypothetical protein BDK51DRAFT_28120, partial [Blyttiomyces helicus]
NKDERKRVRLVSMSQKDISKLSVELTSLAKAERLDKNERAKKQALEDRLKQINDARVELGLAPKSLEEALKQPKKKQAADDDEYSKWYHPTFNPHGPKKPANLELDSASGSESESDETDSESDGSGSESEEKDEKEPDGAPTTSEQPARGTSPIPMIQFEDLGNIPLPDGPGPSDESQVYSMLDLPEIRNRADYMPTAHAAAQAVGGVTAAAPPPAFRPPVAPMWPRPPQFMGAMQPRWLFE